MNIAFLAGSVELGLLYALTVLGVFLTFRVLDFPDLTVDGSFTLGGGTAAILIIHGIHPAAASLIAIGTGALAGICTGVLHTRGRVTPLLAGILVMTGLYSINLRVMGRANVPLLGADTVYQHVPVLADGKYAVLAVSGLTVLVIVMLLSWFLRTNLGLAIRATGDNEVMIKSVGGNAKLMKIVGLCLGNALVSLSGALVAQYQGFADISMGIGMIIAGLASVIIGEVLFGSGWPVRGLIAVVCGSVLYRLIIAVVLRLGFEPTDLKLFTAVLVTAALVLPGLNLGQKISLRGYRDAAAGKSDQDIPSGHC